MKQQQALDILKTGANVFLTGEPGSGKTHTVNEYIRYLKRAKVRVAVTASTGIAATHLGGVTVHSWSGIGIKRDLDDFEVDRIADTERIAKKIADTKVLLIDEISMVDGARLDSIERVCRAIKQSEEPFGGLQVVLVGDFFQLPPVTSEDEDLQFAFAAGAWERGGLVTCYLSEQYRQEDERFLQILSAMRRRQISQAHCRALDERCRQPAGTAGQMPYLFSHNADVDRLNQEKLSRLPGPTRTFHMKTVGRRGYVEQLLKGCLSPERLELKEGAAVMFVKNSPQGKFVNGSLGTLIGFDKGNRCPIVQLQAGGRKIVATPMEWVMEDNGRQRAALVQIPLRLAWAITVHKSQGMSLDAARVDLRQAFVPGQGYVALSRLRTLAGLFLAGYNDVALQVHEEVAAVDEQFREQSRESAAAFGELADQELLTMHSNFIKAMGGVMSDRGASKQAHWDPVRIAEVRRQHPNAYRPWKKDDDERLKALAGTGEKVQELSEHFGRQPSAIRSRLRKLGM